jgi:GxxExxY protein
MALQRDGLSIRRAYVLDLLVERQVIVEVKAVAQIAPVHRAQLLTYLRLTGLEVGLIINFNVPRLVDGVKRVVNNYKSAEDE